MNKACATFIFTVIFTFGLHSQASVVLEDEFSHLNYKGSFYGSLIENGAGAMYGYTGSFRFTGNHYESIFIKDINSDSEENLLPIPMRHASIGFRYVEEGSFAIIERNGLKYLSLSNESNSYTYKPELGVLFSSDFLMLFDGAQLLFSSDEGPILQYLQPRITSVTSSSYLTEGSTEYNGDNFILHKTFENRPWVEGVEGDGVGESVHIFVDAPDLHPSRILIANGYIDFSKPYLYRYNNRVKVLRIEVPSQELSFEVELEDTAQFQEIRLPEAIDEITSEIVFTIVDVYPGTRWQDTTISRIIVLGDPE